MTSENLVQKVKKVQKEEARLCGNYEYNQDLFKAIDVLREAGFRVSAAPVLGMIEPELNYGSFTYYGLEEIREFVEHYKETGKILRPKPRYEWCD
ncbi:hypothetical protein AYK26_03510 [Euryarchaeota archaeon SM23-78]|nr:MAG: hypothetical protein AYK26_03510 [Euryarchaeota archaeon SM23-78]MBW3000561.1 hypothetical protein [Candidatus Woesearchaeota archaeon]